jgi:hypothetical protein
VAAGRTGFSGVEDGVVVGEGASSSGFSGGRRGGGLGILCSKQTRERAAAGMGEEEARGLGNSPRGSTAAGFSGATAGAARKSGSLTARFRCSVNFP